MHARKKNDSDFIKTKKFTNLKRFEERKHQMSIIQLKTIALDSRYHKLTFWSNDQKTSIWKQLENEIKEYEVNSITIVEREYSQESNSDEYKPVKPPGKKYYDLLMPIETEKTKTKEINYININVRQLKQVIIKIYYYGGNAMRKYIQQVAKNI